MLKELSLQYTGISKKKDAWETLFVLHEDSKVVLFGKIQNVLHATIGRMHLGPQVLSFVERPIVYTLSLFGRVQYPNRG
jgi:hypothetical protein